MYLRKRIYAPELVRRNTLQLFSFEVMLIPGFYVFTVTVFCFFAEQL